MKVKIVEKRTGKEVRRFENVESYKVYSLAYRIQMVINGKAVNYGYGSCMKVIVE